MKLSFIYFIALLYVTPSYADTMIVKVPVLNVRKCPNTDCGIVSKLSKGDKVKVAETTKGWARIEMSKDTNGYVISRSLRKSYFYLWYYVAGFIILYLLCVVLTDSYQSRCPKCNKWNALLEIEREEIEHVKSSMKKVAYTKHKTHTTSREFFVPATLYTYKVTNQCKYCDAKFTEIQREKREN